MQLLKRAAGVLTAAALLLGAAQAIPQAGEMALSAQAADSTYPVQEFRMGIGDVNRNINISSTESGSYLNSWTDNGTQNEKWYLNYVSSGVYEIVNSATGYVVTNNGGIAVISPDVDGTNQRWNITAVEQDFDGFDLYYKIVSNADSTLGLTFVPDSNAITVATYTGDIYQKYRLNLDGLEGYAANAYVNGQMKAGTIGGLLGETVFVSTVADLIAALDSTEPKTVVVTAELDLANQAKDDQRIRDNKTIVGSYSSNTIYDSQLRNDDFWGADAAPSNNIVIRNVNFVARTLNSNNCGVILLQFYGVRNLWVDHCDFSATFGQNKDSEVGKFLWINTPAANWSDGVYNAINPDYITISYNYFKNRYWTFAFGSQNTDTSRLHTSVMFNKWEECSRRCPQYSNGYDHNYNNYHTVTSSSNANQSSQIIGGEGSRVLNENCRFEAMTNNEVDYDKNSCISFKDQGSYTSGTVGGTPSALSVTAKGTALNPAESYGYSLVAAYNSAGTDIKAFCNKYSGCFKKYADIQYITNSALSAYVIETYACPFLKEIAVGDGPVQMGVEMDTTHKYSFRNVGSDLLLTLAADAANGTDVQQGGDTGINGWTLVAAEDGYYKIYSAAGDGKTYLLDVENGAADNGTNIGIWSDTDSDAQLFKFLDNGDDTYTITTKATADASCLGVVLGSTETGASVVQWERDASDNQKWIVEIQVDPLAGTLIQNLLVADLATYQNWSIDENLAVGDLVFGDRTVTYATIPTELLGAEAVLTACDSKNSTENLAVFTAGADMTAYVALDERVTTVPTWIAAWTRTELTVTSSNDVTYVLYSKECAAGEQVTLGANGQSSGCVNYTVFAVGATGSVAGDVNADGAFTVADIIAMQKYLVNAGTLENWETGDLCKDGYLDALDLCSMKRALLQ